MRQRGQTESTAIANPYTLTWILWDFIEQKPSLFIIRRLNELASALSESYRTAALSGRLLKPCLFPAHFSGPRG
jgi:hypothetical protein